MDNLIYFFGAGASCQAVPLVDDFTQKLDNYANYVFQVCGNHDNFNKNDVNDYIMAIRWLAREGNKHHSIDTFAKVLYDNGRNEELEKLKAVLSSYLTVVQAEHNVDTRYVALLASLENRNGVTGIPQNVSFITWNYDLQLEKAFSNYIADSRKLVERITMSENLLRLNGHCGRSWHDFNVDDIEIIWKPQPSANNYRVGLELFKRNQRTDISFAWENRMLISLKPQMVDATKLIIVGYSFPDLNKAIDQKIFDQLSKISKVYLQYPEGHSEIERKIRILNPSLDNFEHISNTNKFYTIY